MKLKLFALPLSFLVGSGLHASVILGNLGQPADSANASVQSSFWVAQRFITDGNTYTVGSVTLRGAKHSSHSNNMLHIFSDDGGGNVDSLLYSFDASSMTDTISEQTFSLTSGSGALSASTSYWLAFEADNINTGLWSQTSGLGPSDGAGSIPVDRAFSGDGGSSWSNFSSPSSTLMFELEAVPEPSVLGLITVFAAGMALFRRRMKTRE